MPADLALRYTDPWPICTFHAYRCFPVDRHPAFVIYTDRAGPIHLCKTSLDNRLDNADDDPELEPLALQFLTLGHDDQYDDGETCPS